MLTVAEPPLRTRAIHRIIMEGLLFAGVKKPGIVVHSLRHLTPTVALLNDANPTRVQKMMRHQHYATTEIYVEEVQKLLEGAEEAVTQIGTSTNLFSQCGMDPIGMGSMRGTLLLARIYGLTGQTLRYGATHSGDVKK